ncbi:MAG: YceI family protein [Ktedonobacterales bacterium]
MGHWLRSSGRRALLVVLAAALLAVVAGALVARQIVFGGTPALHGGRTTANGSRPCAISHLPAGSEAFALDSQDSSASYTAHFLAAGQSVPGTVTGETSAITGEFLLDMTPAPTLQSLKLSVDLRTLDSGSADRDQHVRNDTFDSSRFPFAVFAVAQARILSGSYSEGESIRFSLPGQLTLHGVTRPATFAMQGKRQADAVTGSGTTVIQLQDFGMKDPQLTSIVPITIDKDITLMIQLTAVKEACLHQD